MDWIYLVLAGRLEFGWPVGLKIAQHPDTRWPGIILAVAFVAAGGLMLWLAQHDIPLGTAYAVWTGTGAAGTFAVRVWYYGDAASAARFAGVAMIVGGVVTLKLATA